MRHHISRRHLHVLKNQEGTRPTDIINITGTPKAQYPRQIRKVQVLRRNNQFLRTHHLEKTYSHGPRKD